MKLDDKEFKRMKELDKKVKAKTASEAEKAECEALHAKRNDRGSNSIEWWKNYPSLLKDVVNIPFNWIPGTTVRVLNDSANYDELQLGAVAIAHYIPVIGPSKDATSPFNVQIRQLWLDLHRKYRGIGTYQQSDLGIAIVAINSYFTTLAKFERIYGILNTYHIGNRVVPYGLKDALHIDNSLEVRLSDFRYLLNLYIEKSKQLCLPRGLSVLESDIIAMSNLFMDSGNRRAFLFGFDTDTFGVYDPTALSTGGSVKFVDANVHGCMNGGTPTSNESAYTLQDITDILEEQLNALITDDDIARICSDLLAAYGQENVMGLVSIPEDYRVEPVHDYERQVQFHNLTICGRTFGMYHQSVLDATTAASDYTNDGVKYVIYQYNDNVICRLGRGGGTFAVVGGTTCPTFASALNAEMNKTGDVLFDTWVESPGETEIMCGTRYTALSDKPITVATNVSRQEVLSFGTAIVEYVQVYWYTGTQYTFGTIQGTVIEESAFKTNVYQFMKLMQMDWHPTFYVSDSGDYELFGDVDNFAVISAANLDRLHEVALLSGFKIPMVSGASER